MKYLLSCFIFLLSFSISANAQNSFDLAELEKGETLLHISATERVNVPQDLLTASMNYLAIGKERKDLQDEVNKAMKKAVVLAKQYEGVEVTTGSYYVYENRRIKHRDKNSKDHEEIVEWRAQQNLTLKSKKTDELLDLVGKLQSINLDVQSLNYSLSPEKYHATTDSLLEAALIKLKTRAERSARAIGKSKADFVEVNVNGTNHHRPRQYYAKSMMMAESVADHAVEAPSAEPGKTEVSLTVNTRAVLRP